MRIRGGVWEGCDGLKIRGNMGRRSVSGEKKPRLKDKRAKPERKIYAETRRHFRTPPLKFHLDHARDNYQWGDQL